MSDEDIHQHSRAAYEMLEEFEVGELGGGEKIVSEGRLTNFWYLMMLTSGKTGFAMTTSSPPTLIFFPTTTLTNSLT